MVDVAGVANVNDDSAFTFRNFEALCKSKRKWMILSMEVSDTTGNDAETLWRDETVQEVLQSNFLLWHRRFQSEEAFTERSEVHQNSWNTLTIDYLPIILIIDPITTKTVLQVFGKIDCVEFNELLIKTFEKLVVGHYEKSPKTVDTRTRKSQDECVEEDDREYHYDEDLYI